MSFKFPIGVATIYISKLISFIILLSIFIISCTPVNLSDQPQELSKIENKKDENLEIIEKKDTVIKNAIEKKSKSYFEPTSIDKNITLLFSSKSNLKFTKQFVNILELAVYNKNLQEISFDVQFFENNKQLEEIILKNIKKGKIFIGPIDTNDTKVAKSFCEDELIFFSFTSDTSLAGDCVYLLNFFPKNELEQLFISLEKDSKVALLYPENEYGYMINFLIDDIVNKTEVIIINRSSYKNDLSNVRDAIKELGKYELRKYELERQKSILSNKKDNQSKKRLKKLSKFKTTTDYDFTHVLIADYGLNLLQVAPLLPYYDIDPNVVQFLSTGVIDDENFFFEPSLQGTIFPGVEINKRISLIDQYKQIYDEKLLRISTLPYDLIGLLNYTYSRNLTIQEMNKLLNSSSVKFDGVDGKFFFKNNMIERDLDILKIMDGKATKID